MKRTRMLEMGRVQASSIDRDPGGANRRARQRLRWGAVAVGVCMLSAPLALGAATAAFATAATTVQRPSNARFAREAAVLTGQGLSSARADRAIALQTAVANAGLVAKIEAALGTGYAGVWFNPPTAEFHIGVTSRASRQAAERLVAPTGLVADVAYTRVRSTRVQLFAAQHQWNIRLARLFAHQDAKTAIASQENALSVSLSSSVPREERDALARDAATWSVNVSVTTVPPSQVRTAPKNMSTSCEFESQGDAFCEKTITSGVSITGQYVDEDGDDAEAGCTAGPMMVEGTETFLLTAGHCFTSIEPDGTITNITSWFSEYPTKPKVAKAREIGKAGKFFSPVVQVKYDTGEIVVSPAPSEFAREPTPPPLFPDPVPADMAEWGKFGETPPQKVARRVPPAVIASTEVSGEEKSVENQVNCHEGAVSGEQCGIVGKAGVKLGKTENLVEDSACAEHGDSGGPYFFRKGKEVLIQGTEVGGPEELCNISGMPENASLCVRFKPGKYSDNECKKAVARGKYEWVAPGTCYKMKRGVWRDRACTIKAPEKGGRPRGKFEKAKIVSYYEPMEQILKAYGPKQKLLTTATESRS